MMKLESEILDGRSLTAGTDNESQTRSIANAINVRNVNFKFWHAGKMFLFYSLGSSEFFFHFLHLVFFREKINGHAK